MTDDILACIPGLIGRLRTDILHGDEDLAADALEIAQVRIAALEAERDEYRMHAQEQVAERHKAETEAARYRAVWEHVKAAADRAYFGSGPRTKERALAETILGIGSPALPVEQEPSQSWSANTASGEQPDTPMWVTSKRPPKVDRPRGPSVGEQLRAGREPSDGR
jgi:hypothetical protein